MLPNDVREALDIAFQALEISLDHFEEIEINGEMWSPYKVLDIVGNARNALDAQPHPESIPEPELVDDGFYGECSCCGYEFGPGELDLPTPLFVVEESGKSRDTPNGPGEHWAFGYIDCPNCHAHLPYGVS